MLPCAGSSGIGGGQISDEREYNHTADVYDGGAGACDSDHQDFPRSAASDPISARRHRAEPYDARMGEQHLADIAAALYALPLEEFVGARMAAAKIAAAETGRSLAVEVRGLPKPSVAAWAVNMLALHRPDAVSQLTELGQSMRAAQADLDASALRELAQERRRLLASIMETVRTVAEQQGRKISEGIATEVEQTLRAATVDEGAAAAVRTGQLLRGLSADGVDLVDLQDALAVPSFLARPAIRSVAAPLVSPARQPSPSARTGGLTDKKQPSPADQPRLKAVGAVRPAPTPSAVERANARLSEAEEEAQHATKEAAKRSDESRDASADMARLADEARLLRDRLKRVEEDLEQARKRRDGAAANMQLATRAAEKATRAEVLARERVLRLRNTPD